MSADCWWRDYDAVILDALPPGSRILDVGCGDGGLVHRLVERGLDAVGIDPRAPDHPRLLQTRVELVGDLGDFDAICAVMALHHADLGPVIPTLGRLLRVGGCLFVYELAREAYDERAEAWLAAHDTSGTDNSVAGWRVEHAGLHSGAAVRAALAETFDLRTEHERPYLARMLDLHDLERDEQTRINNHELPALGRWYVAHVRDVSDD